MRLGIAALFLGHSVFSVPAAFAGKDTGGCYQGCMPGRYGCLCEYACRCVGEFEECIDGPSGSGQCRCQLGYEAQCGSVSPLRPQLEVPRSEAQDTLETLNFDIPAGAMQHIAQAAGYFTNHIADDVHDRGRSSSLWRVKTPLVWDSNTQWDRRQVYGATVSHSVPVPFPTARANHRVATDQDDGKQQRDEPATVIVNHDILPLLNLRSDQVQRDRFAEIFSGNEVVEGAVPFAHCYGGFQFGNWAGQLGDGRAVSLGHVIQVEERNPALAAIESATACNESENCDTSVDVGRWELQLKGAGRTPYSRRGDGRAVLESCCREFLACAHLAALGIPATKALAVVRLGFNFALARDPYYSGKSTLMPAGTVVRLLPSFLRFGSMQLAAMRQGLDGVLLIALNALQNLYALDSRHEPDPMALLSRARWLHTDVHGSDLPNEHQISPALHHMCFYGAPPRQTRRPTNAPKRKRRRGRQHRTALGPSDSNLLEVGAVCTDFYATFDVKFDSTNDLLDWVSEKGSSLQREEVGLLECLFLRVVQRSAAMVAAWMAAGFVHGVMNTDNMSLLGFTMDLNVFGFMERFDREYTANFIDSESRYRYDRQPEMMRWNLRKLAEAMSGQFNLETQPSNQRAPRQTASKSKVGWMRFGDADELLGHFDRVYGHCFHQQMRLRFGLRPVFDGDTTADRRTGSELIAPWHAWLQATGADYNSAYLALAEVLQKAAALSDASTSGALSRDVLSTRSDGLTYLTSETAMQTLEVGGDALSVQGAGEASDAKLALRSFLAAWAVEIETIDEVDRGKNISHSEASIVHTLAHTLKNAAVQIRNSVPTFTMRTGAIRAVTETVASARNHSESYSQLEAALQLLRSPFVENVTQHSDGDACEPDKPHNRAHVLEELASGRTRATESVAAGQVAASLRKIPVDSNYLRTSCGAQ